MATGHHDEQSGPGRKIHGLDASEREAQRRDQILDSALTLFADQGYANTSVEQICAGANVSTKSFYRIYDNREDVYLAVYESFRADVLDRLGDVLEAATADEGASGLPQAPTDRPRGATSTSEELLLDTLVDAYFADSRCALVIQGPSRAVTPAIERVRRDTRRLAADFLETVWRSYGPEGSYGGVAVAVIGGIFDLFTTALVDGHALSEEELASLREEVKRFYGAVRAGLSAAGESGR